MGEFCKVQGSNGIRQSSSEVEGHESGEVWGMDFPLDLENLSIFYASANHSRPEVCFLSVRESACASRTLSTQYLEKYRTYLHQTSSTLHFGIRKNASILGSKGQSSRSRWDAKNAPLALLMRYLENYGRNFNTPIAKL